jgi:hypothetical protein
VQACDRRARLYGSRHRFATGENLVQRSPLQLVSVFSFDVLCDEFASNWWHAVAVERLWLSESQGGEVAREIHIGAVQTRKDHLLAWGCVTPDDSTR